jgi:phage anti-repressor protein
MKANLKKLLEGMKTYPSWSTNSIYPLKIEELDDSILVYYYTKTNKKISHVFPKKLI